MNQEARQSGQAVREARWAVHPAANFPVYLPLHDGGDGLGQGHSTGQAVVDFVGKEASVCRPCQLGKSLAGLRFGTCRIGDHPNGERPGSCSGCTGFRASDTGQVSRFKRCPDRPDCSM